MAVWAEGDRILKAALYDYSRHKTTVIPATRNYVTLASKTTKKSFTDFLEKQHVMLPLMPALEI
ncbi:hypothetical protein ICN42_09395 [Polynucleobacter sp. 71A-WALBACH]|uniref:hypothetical protein n=1 Tax=Polynucleobacter sp. 71A-WALBACH TaxID=2689097 RepID=UPI001C0D3094|nr:hypothetical protein [Polynucleobacter sp. 71A-WALBACH]MBU3594308.1 hypothetical protein [Polynucleobacter sp. 71A-WALBACH]